MSANGISSSDHNKLHANSFHWRNDSGELDVFEAARYFSSIDENRDYNSIPPHNNVMEKQVNSKENKKLYKQTSSPGGRLSSFLNSLLNQTHLKKKKNSKSTDLEQEENPGTWRRKRRRSISHFNSTKSEKNFGADDSKSVYSSSSSSFMTPGTYANTPMKWYKEFRSFTDHQKHVLSVPKKSVNFTASSLKNDVRRGSINCAVIRNGGSEKYSKNEFFGFSNDDGDDSDSSSDLFDLPNHDLDFYSSTGLPVYETTRVNSIRRGPIVVVIP